MSVFLKNNSQLKRFLSPKILCHTSWKYYYSTQQKKEQKQKQKQKLDVNEENEINVRQNSVAEKIPILDLPELKVSASDILRDSKSNNILSESANDDNDDDKLNEESATLPKTKKTDAKLSEMKLEDSPPALKEVRSYMNKHPDKVILTELGKFYELYFENADVYGPKLNLKVVKKNYATAKVSMAGFPSHYCLKYIDQLVNTYGVSVVLVKQYLKDPSFKKSNVKRFYRKIYRIITPGTIIEQDMLDHEKNNFLLSIHFPPSFLNNTVPVNMKIGLSWCDVSTTEFFVQETSLVNLVNDLHRIKPTEVIINENFKNKLLDKLNLIFLKSFNINWVNVDINESFNYSNYYTMFFEKKEKKLKDAFDSLSRPERFSVFALLDYVREQFDIEDDQTKMLQVADVNKQEAASTLPVTKFKEDSAIQSDEIIEEVNKIDLNSFNFSIPRKTKLENFMLIDTSAREALEITETIKDRSRKNTLFSTIKRTITPSGTRMLRNWLDAPPFDLTELKRRLLLVKIFADPKFEIHKLYMMQALRSLSNYDALRLLFEISFNSNLMSSNSITNESNNIKLGWNYLNLLKILKGYNSIRQILHSYYDENLKHIGSKGAQSTNKLLHDQIAKIIVHDKLIDKIEGLINKENIEAIYVSLNEAEEEGEEGSTDLDYSNSNSSSNNVSINNPFSMKRSFFPDMTWIINTKNASEDSGLVRLHNQLDELMKEKNALEEKLNQKASELQIKHCELRIENDFPNIYIQFSVKAKLTAAKLNETFEITNTFKQSKTSRNFTNAAWESLGFKILRTIKKIKYEELKFLNLLRLDVLQNFETIKSTAATIDYLDVLLSFANLSSEFNLVCPQLNKKLELNIVNGRHLTVEHNLKNSIVEFQANDCLLSNDGKLGYVISGPNMGGKSTYLRQNAIIVILAQIGSFVPADKAVIGLVDKIFTRIGSSDDITSNSSTFMTEMSETSNGLAMSTERSLLIFDEIGRGTSNNEGIAIAFGILKHMSNVLKSRFLFATHYAPELYRLIQINDVFDKQNTINDKVAYYHTSLMSGLLNTYLKKKSENLTNSNIFNGRFFDHKLVPGISKYSHATTVAKLAQVPSSVIQNAEVALKLIEFEKTNGDKQENAEAIKKFFKFDDPT